MVLGKLDNSSRQETEINPYLTHTQKLKWIKDINVKPDMVNFLEKNIGEKTS